jgi:hypothetical protein
VYQFDEFVVQPSRLHVQPRRLHHNLRHYQRGVENGTVGIEIVGVAWRASGNRRRSSSLGDDDAREQCKVFEGIGGVWQVLFRQRFMSRVRTA